MAMPCDPSSSTQSFSANLQDTPPEEAHGRHHIHSNGKCVNVFGDDVSGFLLELTDCSYDYSANDRELFGFNEYAEWSGTVMWGSQCLGIDAPADMGYAVLPQDCEEGKASQHWVGRDGRIVMPSCADCVEPPPAAGFCWDLYPHQDGNPYFAKGQVMAMPCDLSSSTQSFSANLQDTPPEEAHGRHHIHSSGKCVHVFGDDVSGFLLELDDCNYDYSTNEQELFALPSN